MSKLLGWGLVLGVFLTGCTASRTVIVHERTTPPPPAVQTQGQDHSSRVHTRNGIRFYERGHYRKAIRQFELAIAKDPDNWEAHFYLAECYRELRDFDRCLVHYDRVREMHEDDPRWTARVEFGIGIVFEQRGDFQKARTHFELALVANPGYEPAQRAKLRLTSKKFKHQDEEDDRRHQGRGKKHDD